jgi:hypothetical protein
MADIDDSGADKLLRTYEKLEETLSRVDRKIKNVSATDKSMSDDLRDRIKTQRALNSEMKVALAAQVKARSNAKENRATLEETADAYRDLSTEEKKAADALARAMQQGKRSAKEVGSFVDSRIKKIKEYGEYIDDTRKKEEKLYKTKRLTDGPKIRDALRGKLSGASRSLFNTDFREVGTGWKMGRGSALRAGASLEKIKESGSLGPMLSKAAGATGSFLTSISKLTGGLGLAVGAVVAMGKAVIHLDKFMKDLNGKFLTLAGPTVGMSAVRQMEKFNDTIFNVSRNSRLGLQAEDMQRMFSSVAAQGLSMQGLEQRASTADRSGIVNTIETARTLSLQFGTSFEAMGSNMTDQMLNLRSSLEDVKDGFDFMSHSAARAGIQGEKFYQAVEASTSSLSLYGNYLKYASGLLEDFVSKGTMGLKDATSVTTSIMGTFTDPKENRKIVAMMGKATRGIIEGLVADLDKQISDVDKKIATLRDSKTEGNPLANAETDKAIEALQIQKRKLMSDRSIPKIAAETGDLQHMSEALTQLPDKLALVSAYVNKMNVDFFSGKNIATFALMTKQLGLSSEAVMRLKSSMLTAVDTAEDFYDLHGGVLPEITESNKESIDALKGTLMQVAAGEQSFAEAEQGIKGYVNSFKGASEEFKADLLNLMKANPQAASDFLDGSSAGETDMQRKNNLRTYAQSYTLSRKDRGEVFGISEDQQAELIKQTTSIQKQLNIGKDAIEYATAGNDIMKNVATWTYTTAMKANDILQVLQKTDIEKDKQDIEKFKKNQSGDYKTLKSGLLGLPAAIKEVSRLKEGAKLTNLSNEAILEMTTPETEELRKAISVQEGLESKIGQYKTSLGDAVFKAIEEEATAVVTASKDMTEAAKAQTEALKDVSFLLSDEGKEFSAKMSKAIAGLSDSETKDFGDLLETFKTGNSKDRSQAGYEIGSRLHGRSGLTTDLSSPEQLKLIESELTARNKKRLDKNEKTGELEKTFKWFRAALTGGLEEFEEDFFPAEGVEPPKKKDFLFGSSGFAYGSPGDMLIDKESLANGLGANTGGLVDSAVNKMGSGSLAGIENNWGGITVHVNGGDAESIRMAIPELKTALNSFIDQKFKRLMLDKETRV